MIKKSIVNKPASKSVAPKKDAPAEKSVRKTPKSLKLSKKIATAEGLEKIRKKKGK